jgi:sucrose-6F-phosphate phosphohydrolase
MDHVLLVSDVDGTLLGNDRDLMRFAAWHGRYRSRVRLVYASGQFYESVAAMVRGGILPRPWAIIGGLGTDLRIYPSGRPIFAWDERLYKSWDGKRIRETLATRARLELQPEEFQSEYKVSYYLTDASPEELATIRAKLRDCDSGAHIVYSSRRDLDVLPAGIDKGSATKFLAEYLDYEPDEVIVCGNSANDRAMFRHGFRGIVVGNAHAELLAMDCPAVYKSRYFYAAGVLDGLNHWRKRAARSADYVIRERATIGC